MFLAHNMCRSERISHQCVIAREWVIGAGRGHTSSQWLSLWPGLCAGLVFFVRAVGWPAIHVCCEAMSPWLRAEPSTTCQTQSRPRQAIRTSYRRGMVTNRPFRFGVIFDDASSRQDWLDKVRKAEDLGYSSLLIPDHLGEQLAPIPALMLTADATELRIGVGVLANDFRHPVFVAKEAATLDLLSDGRLEFGIGAGWTRSEYEQTGISYERAGVRIERLAESVAIIKGLMAEGPVTFRGDHYQISGLEGYPKPVQKPHPPVFIGGGGKRMLSYAGREADIVGINVNLGSGEWRYDEQGKDRTAAATDEKISWVREAAGERFDDIELQILTTAVEVTSDRMCAAEEFAAMARMTASEAMEAPSFLVGTPSQISDDLRERRANWGFSYIIVGEKGYEAIAPVVEELAGS